MYEHLRNEFAAELSPRFGRGDIENILATLDRTAANYDILEKQTELMVLEDLFPPIAKTYLAVKSLEGLSEKTLAFYKNRLKIFFESVEKQPQDVTANDVRMFLATYKMSKNISDRTLEKFRQILYCFFTWATDEEYLTKNPCRNVNVIKFETKPRKSLTRIQLEQLRRACRTKREIAILDVLYSTGCRVAELVHMRKSDVNVYERSIDIIGKGKKHNVVYLNSNAILSLDEYLNTRHDESDYLFIRERKPYNQINTRTVQHIFAELSEIVGFHVSPHIIRHTTATLSLQSGMQITQVQKMLGHASVATTQIYAETLQEDVKYSHEKYVV